LIIGLPAGSLRLNKGLFRDKRDIRGSQTMAKNGSDGKKTVEAITHEEARRKNIPTVEFQSVMQKEEENPIRVAYARGASELEERC